MSSLFNIQVEQQVKQTENTVLKKSIYRYLDKFDKESIEVIKTWGNAVEKSGRPDLSILYKGQTHYIELKDPLGELSAIQKRTIERYRNIGVPVYVVSSLKEFKEIIY